MREARNEYRIWEGGGNWKTGKISLRRILEKYVEDGRGWNWLRIVSSGGLWY
jgi:hypothetical protein